MIQAAGRVSVTVLVVARVRACDDRLVARADAAWLTAGPASNVKNGALGNHSHVRDALLAAAGVSVRRPLFTGGSWTTWLELPLPVEPTIQVANVVAYRSTAEPNELWAIPDQPPFF